MKLGFILATLQFLKNMFNLEYLLLKSNSTIEQALKVVDASAIKIAIVSDDGKTLKGVLTDGDIRRAIMRKDINLESSIESIYNKNPITCKRGTSMKQIKSLMKEKKVLHIIEVTEEGEILHLHLGNDLQAQVSNYTAVIMAGGLGTRLMPLTENIPKPMIKINGKPILEIIIANLKSQGFAKVYISVNYKKEIIMDYFKDGKSFGLKIEYLIETERLGTGGSLSLLPADVDQSFIVTNADILSDIHFGNILEQHLQSNSMCSVLITTYKIEVPYGVINLNSEGYFKNLVEKPTYDFLINSGIYALSKDVLKFIPKNQFFNMTDLIEIINKNDTNINLITSENSWHDIGRKEDLAKFNFYTV